MLLLQLLKASSVPWESWIGVQLTF